MDDFHEKYADKFDSWNLGELSIRTPSLVRDIQTRTASAILCEIEGSICDAYIGKDKTEMVFCLGPFKAVFDVADIKAMIEETEESQDPDMVMAVPKTKSVDLGSDFFC